MSGARPEGMNMVEVTDSDIAARDNVHPFTLIRRGESDPAVMLDYEQAAD
jgi:hypothetical protein